MRVMKKKIQYYLKKYRQKKIMYSCLAVFGLLVCFSTSFLLMQSAKADENQTVLSPTLQSTQLYYVDSNNNQIEITDSTIIPENATLRYKVKYNKFSVDSLKDENYTLSYQIPSFLLNPVVESGKGNLIIAQENAGSVYVEEGCLKIKFNTDWLQDKEGDNYTIENLEAWFQSDVDYSKVNGDGSLTYNDGLVDKTIHFTSDILARSVPIQIEKSLVNQSSNSQDGKLLCVNGKYYLQYTLKVSLNSPGYKEAVTVNHIQVKDTFTSNTYVEGYYASDYTKLSNQSENELYVDSENHLIWNVGSITLNPNQSVTKEIQYLVEIKKEYLQVSNITLENRISKIG